MLLNRKAVLLLSAILLVLTTACGLLPAVQPPQSSPTVDIVIETQMVATPAEPVETPAPAETTAPLPAPAVLTVAYVKGGDAWLWKDGGLPKQTTFNGQVWDVRLSDDGQVLAYLNVKDGIHYELWAVNGDGTADRPLVSQEFLAGIDSRAFAVVPHTFDWIPGTHILAFNTRQVFEGPGVIPYNDLNLVNADTGEIKTLLPVGEGGNFYFSPDAAQIALTTGEYITLVNADGTNRRHVLDFPMINTASEYQFYPAPVWAADSSRLMVIIPPQDPWVRPVANTSLYSIATDGSPAALVTEFPASYLPGYQALSPGLEYVVYTKEVGAPEENLREIHLIRLADLSDNLVQSGPVLISYGWAAPQLFIFASDGDTYLVPAEMLTPIPLGSPASEFATVRGDALVYALGSGEQWTLTVRTQGVPAVIDTINGWPLVLDVIP